MLSRNLRLRVRLRFLDTLTRRVSGTTRLCTNKYQAYLLFIERHIAISHTGKGFSAAVHPILPRLKLIFKQRSQQSKVLIYFLPSYTLIKRRE
ncbi:unnamed protein product [Lactuca virosa]|uniref:Uncharacterized protein n=1 Tax=Lactuca virosa TaxID=75947 RepID=A0AAU9NRT0_9ASTR|nr:unnamed protein product [Lactuca virosa]